MIYIKISIDMFKETYRIAALAILKRSVADQIIWRKKKGIVAHVIASLKTFLRTGGWMSLGILCAPRVEVLLRGGLIHHITNIMREIAGRMEEVGYKCRRCESQLVLGMRCLSCGYTNSMRFVL